MIPFGVNISILLIFALFLYALGLYAMATKRNLIKFVIGLELLLDGAHLNFIAFATSWTGMVVDPLAHTLVIISICVGGGVIAVALALSIQAYHIFGTLDVRKMSKLRH